jgi:hypothetical protein
MRLVALIAFVAGCGGTQKASPSGPGCAEVAAHLEELAVADNSGAEAPPMTRAQLAHECQSWSAERRSCMLAAKTQEETIGCPPD